MDPHPVFIFQADGRPAWHAYAPERLSASVAAQIIPKVRAVGAHGDRDAVKEPLLKPAQIYFRRERVAATRASAAPFAPDMPWPMRALAGIFPRFARTLGKRIAVEEAIERPPPGDANEDATRYLSLHHHRADALATFYANLHRSVFLLVYALGALALIFVVVALGLGEQHVLGMEAKYLFTGFELSVLVVLGALVMTDNLLRWRDRWLEYRLLAELLREADLLAQIGRPMPIVRIDELAQDLPGRAWVTIVCCAILRRAGVVTRTFDPAFLSSLRDYAADTRLQDQIAYHRKAEARNESIGQVLRVFGLATFVLTIVAAAVKLTWHGLGDMLQLGMLAGILPALAYACFGTRNQAEFEIVSRRSERMIAKLRRYKSRIKALEGDMLTSEALGREILGAAAVMRHDAADWTSIFEVKETEAA